MGLLSVDRRLCRYTYMHACMRVHACMYAQACVHYRTLPNHTYVWLYVCVLGCMHIYIYIRELYSIHKYKILECVVYVQRTYVSAVGFEPCQGPMTRLHHPPVPNTWPCSRPQEKALRQWQKDVFVASPPRLGRVIGTCKLGL